MDLAARNLVPESIEADMDTTFITGPFSHDLLICVLEDLYPTLRNGRDYLVAHDIYDDGTHSDPLIVKWTADVPQPLEDALKARFALYATYYRAIFARKFRDACLDGTDGKDNIPGPKGDAWRTYRQALRDLPMCAGFPDNFEWPEYPGERK